MSDRYEVLPSSNGYAIRDKQGRMGSDIVADEISEEFANKVVAALNQPAPCGPGLTEEERVAVQYAADCLRVRTGPATADILDNLLARDAKADTVITKGEYVEPTMTPDIARDILTDVPDTVTLRREVLTRLVKVSIAHIGAAYGEPGWNVKTNEAIAEAEAALAAEGGE